MIAKVALLFLGVYWVNCEDFKDICLNNHNTLRGEENENLPPMVWDDELAAASTTHARNCDYRYSSAHDYGENIAVQGSLRPLDVNTVGAQLIRHWVDYEKQFNDGTWSCCSERGYSCCEYAQVVSKSTTSVGCGYAQCGVMPNLLVLVCRYKPSGKIRGESP